MRRRGDPLRFCSLLPRPPGTVNEQVHHSQPNERDYQELRDPSGKRDWITSHQELPAKGKRDLELTAEEGDRTTGCVQEAHCTDRDRNLSY